MNEYDGHLQNSVKINSLICEAFGVDPSRVASINIEVRAGSCPRATAELLVTNAVAERIAGVVKNFVVTEAE